MYESLGVVSVWIFLQSQYFGDRIFSLRIYCGPDYPEVAPVVHFINQVSLGNNVNEKGQVVFIHPIFPSQSLLHESSLFRLVVFWPFVLVNGTVSNCSFPLSPPPRLPGIRSFVRSFIFLLLFLCLCSCSTILSGILPCVSKMSWSVHFSLWKENSAIRLNLLRDWFTKTYPYSLMISQKSWGIGCVGLCIFISIYSFSFTPSDCCPMNIEWEGICSTNSTDGNGKERADRSEWECPFSSCYVDQGVLLLSFLTLFFSVPLFIVWTRFLFILCMPICMVRNYESTNANGVWLYPICSFSFIILEHLVFFFLNFCSCSYQCKLKKQQHSTTISNKQNTSFYSSSVRISLWNFSLFPLVPLPTNNKRNNQPNRKEIPTS